MKGAVGLTYEGVLRALAREDLFTNWMEELSPIVNPLSLQIDSRDVLVPIKSKELSDSLEGVEKHLSQAEYAEITFIINEIKTNQLKMIELFNKIRDYIVGDQGLSTLIPSATIYRVPIPPDVISTIRKNLNSLKKSNFYFRTMFEYQIRTVAQWKELVIKSMHVLSHMLRLDQKVRDVLNIYKDDQTIFINHLQRAKNIMEQFYTYRQTFLNYLMGTKNAQQFQNLLQ